MLIAALLSSLIAPAAQAQGSGERAGRFVVTSPDGTPLKNPGKPPQTLDERRKRIQKETPEQVRTRSNHLNKIKKNEKVGPRLAGDFPPAAMTECYDADYNGANTVTLSHWKWCKKALGSYSSYENCKGPPPGNGCVEIGSVQFRIGIMGQGYQDKNDRSARKARYWMMLDQPQTFGAPRITDQLGFTGVCTSFNSGAACDAAAGNGRIDSIAGWMQAGYVDWKYSSPEGSLSGDKIAYMDFTLNSMVFQEYPVPGIMIPPGEAGFRCDSATYMKWPVGVPSYGCVFDGVTSIWNFKAEPGVAQTAKHVWTAQFKPNSTRPPTVGDKDIPGSIQSGESLERLAGAAGSENDVLHKKNRDKSTAACVTNFGKSYSRGATLDCDEYPMASTREGASTGGVEDDSTGHFSVRPLNGGDNQAAGRLLNTFYLDERIINTDTFFVNVLAADGGKYPGVDEPDGVSSPVSNRSCDLRQPEVHDVKTSAAPEKTFLNYAKNTPDGWTGGDSTFSAKLPDGRILWLFSDTFLGPLNSNGTRPTSAQLVNSTFVVQDGDKMTTLRGGTKTKPEGLMKPAADKHWYWLGDGQLHKEGNTTYLQVIFQEYYKFGPGNWDFKHKANFVATFSLDDLGTAHGHEPLYIEPVPSTPGVGWGSALLPAGLSGDRYTYIYGVDDAPLNKKMRIARVEGTDLTGKWEYYNPGAGGWMRSEKQAANVHTGIANEYSVTPWNGGFMAVSQTSKEGFSGQIKASVSCSPHGPFQLETDVYRMPEPGPWGSYANPNVISYNAHVHRTKLPDGLGPYTLSYNVNSMDNRVNPNADHYSDPSIYKPRFITFQMSPRGGTVRPPGR
ncbi:NucA/NucB deoxyribonuclease domain-containing protein [Streptomyces kanamyceticus]|uniref:DUF4185 domain-containing protein n=1 Tax=Streptomyces kanamyceticus TaxID=1967 RepID=Q1EQR0_STRKN|nr:DUF4185 domain-containing protein [Streptomyces kanamyceticus]QEU90504.1 DUF4185 domain-containing protein [Streptomyces kanamyceticus]BAE95460.1 hypothetical protein [Streptomyces kanamyceticus]